MCIRDRIYIATFSITNITFVVSIQNTNVANTLVMIATAPMLSAILGAIFLKEPPDRKTLISIIITFFAIIYIFFDSLKVGNLYGDVLGFITAFGLALGAITIRSAKTKNLVPAAVVGKLFVASFALFFIESFVLIDRDLFIVPLMCILCVAIPFVLVTIAPRFITAAAVINLGAIVTSTNGIATHKIHISGTINKSLSISTKLSIKNKAKEATNNLPTTAAGTKFFVLADLIVIAPKAKPKAVIKPKTSP